MKKKIKIGFVVLVFIVVSVCGVSVYRHFTAPKKESVPCFLFIIIFILS